MKIISLILLTMLTTLNPILADTGVYYSHMDDWDDHMTEFSLLGMFMWTMMILWIVLLLSAIYYLIKKANKSN